MDKCHLRQRFQWHLLSNTFKCIIFSQNHFLSSCSSWMVNPRQLLSYPACTVAHTAAKPGLHLCNLCIAPCMSVPYTAACFSKRIHYSALARRWQWEMRFYTLFFYQVLYCDASSQSQIICQIFPGRLGFFNNYLISFTSTQMKPPLGCVWAHPAGENVGGSLKSIFL